MITYRPATSADATAIAQLHVSNWRKYYRGALTEAYLSGAIEAERNEVWANRLSSNDEKLGVFVAEEKGKLKGFICLLLDYDTEFGCMLDNLHVYEGQQGKGIGKQLIQLGAEWVQAQRPESGIYLYVLAQNERAAQVYERLGGTRQAELLKSFSGTPPGGVLTYRYIWKRPEKLLR